MTEDVQKYYVDYIDVMGAFRFVIHKGFADVETYLGPASTQLQRDNYNNSVGLVLQYIKELPIILSEVACRREVTCRDIENDYYHCSDSSQNGIEMVKHDTDGIAVLKWWYAIDRLREIYEVNDCDSWRLYCHTAEHRAKS